MRSPADMDLIQIEITNKCTRTCANCTRLIGHHKEPFFMTLEQIETAIKSLDGFEGNIGLMGGEPTLHPQFTEVLKIYRKLIPEKKRRQFWTSGYKWEEYKKDIERTFLPINISYNDHSKKVPGWHQPLLVAIEEVVEDPKLRWGFIDNCWVQNRWSASITPKGAFFCEVAAAHAHLSPKLGEGIPVVPGWWKGKGICETQKFICNKCSGCLPLPGIYENHGNEDLVSPGNYAKLYPSNKLMTVANIALCEAHIEGRSAEAGDEPGSLRDFPDWQPWRYRNEIHHGPKK